MERFDVAVVGAGAAGLMAAIFAARGGARVVALEGAKKIGAKILISGGGRCNVTHDVVTADDFNGGSRNAIAKVLRELDVAATIAFFEEYGVRLKREETGKLFPVSDSARSVLDALLSAAQAAGAEIRTGQRVDSVDLGARSGFMVESSGGTVVAPRVILATGGRSIPKTGSDGHGYEIARRLGHTITKTFPALVPLVSGKLDWLAELRGTTADVELTVQRTTGAVIRRERGSMLFTHFGVSGPVALDISRHWIAARDEEGAPAVELRCNFVPDVDLEEELMPGKNRDATVASTLRGRVPERVVVAVAQNAGGVAAATRLVQLTREDRRRLLLAFTSLLLPIDRDRGFDFAEVTAGGVPLSEVNLATMESRIQPGLHLCGEILDVDGKIGGYNFQWAWASGKVAGSGVSLVSRT